MNMIDPKKTAARLIQCIKSACAREEYTDAAIGLSGGVDSATSCALTVKALGASHVYPILLPCGSLNDQSTRDARLVINWLKIPNDHVRVINIQPMVDVTVNSIDHRMDEGRRGNIMARMRMVVLYDIRKALPSLVVGTENKTEHVLGYYTEFGDEASDIEPLVSLYKTQVFELAKFLRVPKRILQTPPSAGLWKGQTDEREFGFSYQEADKVLQTGGKEYDPALLTKIQWWIKKGAFKDRLPHCAGSEAVVSLRNAKQSKKVNVPGSS